MGGFGSDRGAGDAAGGGAAAVSVSLRVVMLLGVSGGFGFFADQIGLRAVACGFSDSGWMLFALVSNEGAGDSGMQDDGGREAASSHRRFATK